MEIRRKVDALKTMRLGAGSVMTKQGNAAYLEEIERLMGLLRG